VNGSILHGSVRWFIRVRDVTRKRLAAPLVASVLVHAAAVVLLLTLSFPQENPLPALRTCAVTLLAPVPLPVPVRVAVPVRREVARERPRRFQAPAVVAIPAPRREVVSAPLIDIRGPLLASPEPRVIAVLPAPPLRIDNLTLPVAVVPVAPPAVEVRAAGFSSATSATQRSQGTVRRTGFESVSTADVAAPPSLLARAGFGDATVTSAPGLASGPAVSPLTRAVEILFKPKPVYTVEARGRRIEGEVLLQVLFAASGEVRVLATVRGLGYGLDENAVAATEAIRFRPAERAGGATDSTAIVHIVFQLAY
jgi:TonB family protein